MTGVSPIEEFVSQRLQEGVPLGEALLGAASHEKNRRTAAYLRQAASMIQRLKGQVEESTPTSRTRRTNARVKGG